jgi:hypothetical protein
MEPETIASIRIRKLDGGSTWKVQARVTRQLSQKRQPPTERITTMAIQLNHTIVAALDKDISATFLIEILGLSAPLRVGPFAVVQVGDTSLDYMNVEANGEITSQHYAFLVTEAEFDEIFERIRVRGGCRTGPIPVAASVTGSTLGTAGVGAISTTRTATCWSSSPVRMGAVAQRRPELIPCSRGHWILQITRTALTIKRRAAEARLAAAERSDTHERRRSLTSLLFTVLKVVRIIISANSRTTSKIFSTLTSRPLELLRAAC